MARRLSEYYAEAEQSAWRQVGRQHKWAFVTITILRKIWWLIVLVIVLTIVGAQIRHLFTGDGPGISAPGAPGPGSVWPYVAIGISASAAAVLFAAKWWNPLRSGRAFLIPAVALLLTCVVLVMWVRG